MVKGLLAGKDDPDLDIFGLIGLGVGASQRAKDLVIKGLIAEELELINKELEKFKKGRGAPTKAFSINEIRAHKVLGARNMLQKTGEQIISQKILLDVARQVENILIQYGSVLEKDRVFPKFANERTMQNSVSKGLKKLGIDLKIHE